MIRLSFILFYSIKNVTDFAIVFMIIVVYTHAVILWYGSDISRSVIYVINLYNLLPSANL